MIDKEVESLDQLIISLNELPNHYVYRGHSNASWTLKPTLERILNGTYESRANEFEKYAIDYFKARFHLYSKPYVLPESKLEWLSIMQHYGVPTRMLDFTESSYVALYFALENIMKSHQGEFTIYAIDYRGIQRASFDYLEKEEEQLQITYEERYYRRNELFDIIDGKSHEILWFFEPSVVNPRQERQSGCFLFSGSISQTIEQVLEKNIYENTKNYRFIVPCSLWDSIYTLLKRVNIDSKAIYGDLEGLSKSIKLFIQAYST